MHVGSMNPTLKLNDMAGSQGWDARKKSRKHVTWRQQGTQVGVKRPVDRGQVLSSVITKLGGQGRPGSPSGCGIVTAQTGVSSGCKDERSKQVISRDRVGEESYCQIHRAQKPQEAVAWGSPLGLSLSLLYGTSDPPCHTHSSCPPANIFIFSAPLSSPFKRGCGHDCVLTPHSRSLVNPPHT